MYVCVHASLPLSIYPSPCLSMSLRECVCTCLFLCVNLCVHVCVCLCVCACVCVCVCVCAGGCRRPHCRSCTLTHTHAHPYTFSHKNTCIFLYIHMRTLLHSYQRTHTHVQIDNGTENTGNRKFLRIVPIILFMASYRQTSGVWLLCTYIYVYV